MLTKDQKEVLVKNVRDHIEKSEALFVTNLVGLSSNDAMKFRREVRLAKGNVVITRNTLFRLGAKGTKAENVLAKLKGTNAVAFAFEDAPAVAKVLYDQSKEFEEIARIGKGLLGTKELSKEDVVALAKLPSRDQMLATLLATFNAPVSAFVRVLDSIKRKSEEAGSETVIAPSAN